ncbi:MAG: SoxR reducing system RseC family protein [Bacteroidales bacterium]|jgi:sigma-E factor negative regulatory protein RseC|nr:SoxR reducing system RseC family protein [Bacteroidales bacterium]MCU0408455.1 SoxR reducing system RseC family protein [Bacteroidales bacterium]
MSKQGASATISHEGIVEKADDRSVTVTISASPACSGCHAESSCSLAGKTNKSVTVRGRFDLKAGDRVEIIMNQSLGFLAVLLGYVVPGITIICTLIILLVAGAGELTAGLAAFAAGIVYFLLLMAFRNRINEKFEFSIKPKE